MQHNYPPKDMKRETGTQVVGPPGYRLESYADWVVDGPGEQALWLFGPAGRTPLQTPYIRAENPITIDRFAIAPNGDFIFGARKVASGSCEMFLWVRQKDKSYKLLPETVGHWIVRRQGSRHRGGPIDFVRLLRWTSGGNGVVLAVLYKSGRRNLWHLQEIDLVQGRFAPDKSISEKSLGKFLI